MSYSVLKPKIIVVDTDGVLIDFNKFFDKFIKDRFGKNKLALIFHRISMKVNSFDFISNSYSTLLLILLMYSVIGFKNFFKLKKEFIMYYEDYLECNKENIKQMIIGIRDSEKKPTLVFVKSNNPYARKIVDIDGCNGFIFAKNWGYFKRVVGIYKDVKIIGNNFIDDMLPGKLLKIPHYYIGTSPMKKFFHATKNYETLESFLRN